MSDAWSDKSLDWIKPRRRDPMPRCPFCKSEPRPIAGSHKPGAMFHPAHPFGPCQVLTDGAACGCRIGIAGRDG